MKAGQNYIIGKVIEYAVDDKQYATVKVESVGADIEGVRVDDEVLIPIHAAKVFNGKYFVNAKDILGITE